MTQPNPSEPLREAARVRGRRRPSHPSHTHCSLLAARSASPDPDQLAQLPVIWVKGEAYVNRTDLEAALTRTSSTEVAALKAAIDVMVRRHPDLDGIVPLRAALSQPEPLDARLLGDAIDAVEWPPSIYALGYGDQRWIDEFARRIAAAYARLSETPR